MLRREHLYFPLLVFDVLQSAKEIAYNVRLAMFWEGKLHFQ